MCAACVEATEPKPAVKTWRYHLPSIKGEGWAIVFIDSIGVFTCVSDWGDYGYRWHEAGWGPQEFRQFFIRCEDDYILRKIAPNDTYYGEQTLKNVKRHIVELRRGGTFDRDQAREEWDRLDECEQLRTREDFAVWYQATTKIDCAYELVHYGPEPQALGFMEHVMPRLREVIRAELAAEGLAT